jgi:hypothetical protein
MMNPPARARPAASALGHARADTRGVARTAMDALVTGLALEHTVSMGASVKRVLTAAALA